MLVSTGKATKADCLELDKYFYCVHFKEFDTRVGEAFKEKWCEDDQKAYLSLICTIGGFWIDKIPIQKIMDLAPRRNRPQHIITRILERAGLRLDPAWQIRQLVQLGHVS